jgi:hypothetical protein
MTTLTDPMTLPEMVRDYLACALFAENDQSDPETGGDPLDRNYGIIDFAPEALAQAKADCWAFLRKAAPMLRPLLDRGLLKSVGHDLWLTRNGHGAGFWDRGYPKEVGDALTKIAHDMGQEVPEVADGKIYFL